MSFGIEDVQEHEHSRAEQNKSLWIGDWLKRLRREGQNPPSNDAQRPNTPPKTPETPQRPGLGRRLSKKVGVGLPRSTTFKRQQDESRTNLEPVAPSALERRQRSIARLRALSASPKKKTPKVKRETSAPDLGYHTERFPSIDARIKTSDYGGGFGDDQDQIPPPPPPPPRRECSPAGEDDAYSERSYDSSRTLEDEIRLELERSWILNLSMHFRDKSPREKFFVTYAQTPHKWRRVTVSCDYRHTEPDSLEADLKKTKSQREKSARIYESLRGSLSDIQFYDTVTNLKLETRDERLHVHVTEDVNEIIAYPPIKTIQHLGHIRKFKEHELVFMEHMSGFVYKVNVNGNVWVKKEIPGPDSIDEFLYEVNALSSLTSSSHVIELKGLVISEDESQVKGLLIAYAEKNALVDIIYDNQGKLPWARRERWARQIIEGLKEIHEAGFVQGDFTLSNIVIDGEDKAQVIDINRRGCPIGWEPPEIEALLSSGQRISMFIGIKSDLFQLGMVLWALAMENDEPDLQGRPLTLANAPDQIPGYFRGLIDRCLLKDPVMRPSAKELLREFPASVVEANPDLESLPALRPAPIMPSVPVIKGDPRTHFDNPSQAPNSHVEKLKESSERASSKQASHESLGAESPRYTEMLSRTARSAEQMYQQSSGNERALLNAPLNHETGSSIAPQPSSAGKTGSLPTSSKTNLDSTLSTSDQKRNPTPLSTHQKASSSDSSSQQHKDELQYHDAPETITLDQSSDHNPNRTVDPSWSNTLDDPTSPYEVPLDALSPFDEPISHTATQTNSPPHMKTTTATGNPRRSHNSSLDSRGIPSPPPHVDSGLADVETPRTSLEHQHRYPRDILTPRVPPWENEERQADGPSSMRPPTHIDSGLGNDIGVGHVGLNEGLSFKERVRLSQGLGGGMGEELEGMLRKEGVEG